ncbi:MAG TPA: DUF2442 domain-containing protein [Acetobacteraceae bacterium]|nr:DUF2442 domain-containing protein [Acetobacteraceae bacterium]
MTKQELPRIAAVEPGSAPLSLRVRWRTGAETVVDVSHVVDTYRVLAPLRDNHDLFGRVRVGEHGTDVVWTEQIDMSADMLWHLASEQLTTGPQREPIPAIRSR